VRIGNGAAEQLQLDIFGEAMDSVYFGDRRAGRPRGLTAISDLLGWLADNWDQARAASGTAAAERFHWPGDAWVAFDRGIKRYPARPPAPGAGTAKDARDQVMQRGWNAIGRALSSTTTTRCWTPRCWHGPRRCCAGDVASTLRARDRSWYPTASSR
jgi:hypothetical protein